MYSMTHLGCCILVLFGSEILASEYVLNPTYARTFGLLFGVTRAEFSALSIRVTTLEINYGTLSRDVINLRSDLTRLQMQFESLPRYAPKCPSTVTEGKIPSGLQYCYKVNSTKMDSTGAKAQCASEGGILAEPMFELSATFYTAIKAAFPTETTAVGAAGRFWIGVEKAKVETQFRYLSNNLGIYKPFDVFGSSVAEFLTATTNKYSALFVSPGTSQWAFEENEGPTPSYPFICQFNTAL